MGSFQAIEMKTSKSENIEAVPGKKATLDNLAEKFQLFKNAFDFFYDIKKTEHQKLMLLNCGPGGDGWIASWIQWT